VFGQYTWASRATLDALLAVVRPKRASPRRGMLGPLVLVALLILDTTGVIIAGQVLTTAEVHATRATPTAVSPDTPTPSDRATRKIRPASAPTAVTTETASPPKAVTTTPGPVLTPHPVSVTIDGFLSWALMNRQTGTVTGSANHTTETSSTESMIKIWIAADYLRRQAATGNTPGQQRLDELTTMIRDSDNQAARDIYQLNGGNDVVNRMISTCGLTDTTLVDGTWSQTQITARDATRLGLCVADGRAAGPTWTPWILTQMRQVRGEGRFGIIDALPADIAGGTAIKNGWTLVDDGDWHIACLAIQDQWILAALTHYDGSHGLAYGASVCANVTRQLMTNP
jgi:hypothetical protein